MSFSILPVTFLDVLNVFIMNKVNLHSVSVTGNTTYAATCRCYMMPYREVKHLFSPLLLWFLLTEINNKNNMFQWVSLVSMLVKWYESIFLLPNSPFTFLHPRPRSGPGPSPAVGRCRQSAAFCLASSSAETCAQVSKRKEDSKGFCWQLEPVIVSTVLFPLCFSNQLYRCGLGKTQTLAQDNKAKVKSLTQQRWCCNHRQFPASSKVQCFSLHSASWMSHGRGSSCHMSLRQTDRQTRDSFIINKGFCAPNSTTGF